MTRKIQYTQLHFIHSQAQHNSITTQQHQFHLKLTSCSPYCQTKVPWSKWPPSVVFTLYKAIYSSPISIWISLFYYV